MRIKKEGLDNEQEKKVTAVAMEATGIYWIPVFEMLKNEGFDTCLVNARNIKGVKGRPKSDYADCASGSVALHCYGF